MSQAANPDDSSTESDSDDKPNFSVTRDHGGSSFTVEPAGHSSASLSVGDVFEVEFNTDKSRFDDDEGTITLRDRSRNPRTTVGRENFDETLWAVLVALVR
jgi:hypothetical protein